MSDKCECSFRIRMVGDGCRHCQPQTYIDTLERCIDDEREENSRLEALISELRNDAERYKTVRKMNLPEFEDIYHKNLITGVQFDDLVDSKTIENKDKK